MVPTSLVRELSGPVIVAVSGGCDSVGLLRVLEGAPGLHVSLVVAHLHHGYRAEEADGDAEFVDGLATRLGLPFELGRWAPTRKSHLESDARAARYHWLAEVARRRGASWIALGHTRDDQVETILHRVARGTGVRGLMGMPVRREIASGVQIVRPLLDTRRSDIAAYLQGLGQPWREDSSNRNINQTRSRLRNVTLPLLRRDNASVDEAILRLSAAAREQQANIQSEVASWLRMNPCVESAHCIEVSAAPLRALAMSARVELLRELWRRNGWPEREMTAERWTRLARLASGPQDRCDLPSEVRAIVDKGVFHLKRGTPREIEPWSSATSLHLPVPGRVTWDRLTIVAEFTEDPGRAEQERVDWSRIEPSSEGALQWLEVRWAQSNDRFDPLGMAGHTQSVADFLRGRGLGQQERKEVAVVCDKHGIVWVVGHRIAERVRLRPDSTRVLVLSAESNLKQDIVVAR